MLWIDDSDKFYGKGGNGLSGNNRKDKADRATVEQVGEDPVERLTSGQLCKNIPAARQ